MRHNVLLLLLGCLGCLVNAADDDQPSPPVLEASLVQTASGNVEGIFGNFSRNPVGTVSATTALSGTVNETGCTHYSLPKDAKDPMVVVVRRGICSFVTKAMQAQAAGASGVIVVNTDDWPVDMAGASPEHKSIDIYALSMAKADGEDLLRKDGRTTLRVSVYRPSLWNISEVFIILLATFLVLVGAFFSTADMRKGSPMAQPAEEVVEISPVEAGSAVFLMSGVLIVMFFFMQYLIYVVIFFFCIGGGSTLIQFGSMFLSFYVPTLKKNICSIPLVGPVSQSEAISSVPAFTIVLLWVWFRNTPWGWPFQDLIGAGFLCLFQHTIRVPNIRVATLLLSCMFFFDIFWVFISPLFFHKSVMVTVAKGGGTGEAVPMLLRIPTIGDPLPGVRMLGFGDVAIPGLLISYLLRYDKMSRRGDDLLRGYFLPAVVGYACGLSITIAALCIMGIGQPALLYLVPCTLGTTLLYSSCRGEFRYLWNGQPAHLAADAPLHNESAVPELDAAE